MLWLAGLNQALATGMVPLKGESLLEDRSFLCKQTAASTGKLQCTIETPYLVENRIIVSFLDYMNIF